MAEEGRSYEQDIEQSYQRVLSRLGNLSAEEAEAVQRAFFVAREAHHFMKRQSGEPYILHPLAVAEILVAEMGIEDPVSVQCAFLHDVVEDTEISLADIEREFGAKVAEIIGGLTKIKQPADVDRIDSEQAENFRRLFLTISSDIRVVLVKLADRLHNMRTLQAKRHEKVLKIASETLYIYAPLAHRLGLYEIKSELEDLAFQFSQPSRYAEIRRLLSEGQEDAEQFIERFTRPIREALDQSGLKYTLLHRFKSIYSIYSKMERKGLPFSEVYDTYAVRIILETREGNEAPDCWLVYGIISQSYRHIPKRVRDWITFPKENRYESLHTTVQTPEGRQVEVQIRTTRMDEIAERGVAAHWKYKENGEMQDEFLTRWIGQLRDMLKNPDISSLEAVREFRENLQPNDLFLFTPKMEMIRLPVGSTVLDFAYRIHSRIGDQAIGAKVNNQIVTLDYVLRPGDHVEVLTSRKGKPEQKWMQFIHTERARSHIQAALKRERRELIERGRQLFLRGAHKYGVDEQHEYTRQMVAFFEKSSLEDLFYALGAHRLDLRQINEFIRLVEQEGKAVDLPAAEAPASPAEPGNGASPEVLVLGSAAEDYNYQLAKCCHPIRGDEILGIRSRKMVVHVHRTDCARAIALMSSQGHNIVQARWLDSDAGLEFLAAIEVSGQDRREMLIDLIRIISIKKNMNIQKVTIEGVNQRFRGIFHVYVHSSNELRQLMSELFKVEQVEKVTRYTGDT